MKKIMLPTLLAASIYTAQAQNVGFNATGAAPNASAMVDIASTTSGLLIPRMTTAQRTAIASPAQGLTVYDLTTNTFWYYNGTVWTEIGLNNGWRITGNAGTVATTNFVGTTDNVDFVFRTNNTDRGRFTSGGLLMVGSTTPVFAAGDKLEVTGNYAINGFATAAAGAGVWAENLFGTGTAIVGIGNGTTLGYTLTNGSGIAANGAQMGFASFRNNTTNVNGEGAAYFSGNSSGTGQYAYVSFRNAGTWYKIIGTGTVSTIVRNGEGAGTGNVMFCPEATEILLQDQGSGQLVNGRAHISLDPVYKANIAVNDAHPLRVFVQLEGDCNGVYVTNKTADGFDVVELMGGHSNVAFTWSVSANRADEKDPVTGAVISSNENVRLPAAPGMPAVNKTPAKSTLPNQ